MQLQAEEADQSHRAGPGRSPPSAAAGEEAMDATTTTLSQILFLRGAGVCSADASAFLSPSLYSSFSFSPLSVCRDPRAQTQPRSATLWSNCSAVCKPIELMAKHVYKMLQQGAYTHHYEKYGIEKENMWQALTKLEQINTDYRELGKI